MGEKIVNALSGAVSASDTQKGSRKLSSYRWAVISFTVVVVAYMICQTFGPSHTGLSESFFTQAISALVGLKAIFGGENLLERKMSGGH